MINSTKIPKVHALTKITKVYALIGAVCLLVAILFVLYLRFGLKSKKTDALPKTIVPSTNVSPTNVPPTNVPPTPTNLPVPSRVYTPNLDHFNNPNLATDVVFIYSNSSTRQIGFYKEELLLNENKRCWHVNLDNKKWKSLKHGDLSDITKITLPAGIGIKATAYKYPPNVENNCDSKYKISDINPGETKTFTAGTVDGFSFYKVS